MQNVPDPDEATDIATSSFTKAASWHRSILEAIDAAMRQDRQGVA